VKDIDDAEGLSVNEQLSSSTDTNRVEFTVTGSDNGQTYIGIFNDGTDINMHTGVGTFMLDNLRIEKLDATPPVSTISDLKKLVEEFEETGDISSEEVAHALKLHLAALEQFERIGDNKKVVKHLNGFKDLLIHHKALEHISENAYEILSNSADTLIDKLD